MVADPQRIVALAGDELDALCALGLQSRIVAAALPVGSEAQPSYLGTVVHNVPGVGTRSAPDMAAIAAADASVDAATAAATFYQPIVHGYGGGSYNDNVSGYSYSYRFH